MSIEDSWYIIYLSFYFFKLKIFALQNFVVYCHTSTRITHKCTHVPSLPNLHFISLSIPPFSIVTEPLSEFPKSYSKFSLATYFTYGIVSFHVTLSIQLTPSLLPSHCVLRSAFQVCWHIVDVNHC